MEENNLQCYNRGCGKKFNPEENEDESCCHHPGEPFFHDAYKGWTCCNKKYTDFTEFLNTKGCTFSKHSNIKPPEPEKPLKQDLPDIIEVKPLIKSKLERPSIDTPLVSLKADVSPSLLQQLKSAVKTALPVLSGDSLEIVVGTSCKNNGCSASYDGPDSNDLPCLHHPGVPIFHEGLKYWSCCTKRTSDFNAFLSQVGCTSAQHVWLKEENNSENVECRWDHHQTGTHVIVSIYAKLYCPNRSEIKLNPIRLLVNIVFPEESNAIFNLDGELKGIVNVAESQVTMYGAKIEIKLKKAEPGNWNNLFFPKAVKIDIKPKVVEVEKIQARVESVDLSDL